MRILYATQWFEPEPILKGIQFAKIMRDHGHDVSVVTGFPNYPFGKLYPGYRLALLRRDLIEDVPVDRLPLYPSHSRSAFGRIVNYVSFAISLAAYGLFRRKRPDVIYAYHPPLTVGLAVALVALVRRIPFVYDVQDMWPDTLSATGMLSNRCALRVVDGCCRLVYRLADRIVVQSPGFKRSLLDRDVPEAKIEVIYNWANELDAKPRGDSDLSACTLSERFNIVYAGTMGPAQGLTAVLRAAKLVERTEPRVQCILVGDGIEVDHLRQLAGELGASSVRIMPRMPQSQIADLLSKADVLLVHLKDAPLFEITIPSKTQFYLAMGKPILMAVRGDAAELISRAQAGVVVQPEHVEALAGAMVHLAHLPKSDLAAMGMRGRAFYESEMSAAVGIRRTLAVLASAAAGRKRGLIIKRIFDVIVASAALIILIPVALSVAIIVCTCLGRPVLFRQMRPGLHGKPFCLYKFRTMTDARDVAGQLLPEAERLGAVGKIIRKLSLDEIPQLWNVVRGDMSLVGPRPLLMSYLDRYTPAQARRHEVRPGITGWAQINGRNAICWARKLALDVWYIENRTFALDLKILAMTAVNVWRRKDISAEGHVTMPEFQGSPHKNEDYDSKKT